MRRILWLIMVYFSFIPLNYYFLAGYLLWPVGMHIYRHIHTAVTLACKVDFFNEMFICRLVDSSGNNNVDRYASALQTEFAGLDSLISHSSEVAPLAQHLMAAHLSIDDLIVVVRMSSLASRTPLIKELTAISVETKDASRNLQRLFAQVEGSIDIMVAVNEHLLALLQGTASTTSAVSVYCHILGDYLHSNECAFSSFRINEAYQQTLAQFQQVLSALLLRTNVVQGNLDVIEAKLGVIRDLVAIDGGIVMSEQSDPLTYILTLLRLPTQRMARLNTQLKSIWEISRLRSQALQFIVRTFAGLQELEGALEMLKSMALGAELIDGVPMEVVINTLTMGIERVRHASRNQLMLVGRTPNM